MSDLSRMWNEIKGKLTPEQQGRLPKLKFTEKCDTFDASCKTAHKKLNEAREALWAVYVDGEHEKGDSVRNFFEKIVSALQQPANKDIDKIIGKEILKLDRAKAGLLKAAMQDYAEISKVAENLKLYKG